MLMSCEMQVDMTGIDAVQAVMEEFAPDTPKRRTLQERKAMLAKGRRLGLPVLLWQLVGRPLESLEEAFAPVSVKNCSRVTCAYASCQCLCPSVVCTDSLKPFNTGHGVHIP